MKRCELHWKNDPELVPFEFIPGHVAERFQNPGSRRRGRQSSLREDRQTFDSPAGHGQPHRALDQRIEHHGQEGRVNQPRGPVRFLEIDRRDPELRLEEGVALLDIGLILVNEKDPFAGGLFQVCDQGENAVGARLGPQGGFVPGDGEMQLSNSNLPERGTRPGPAPVGVVGSTDLPAAQADVEETRRGGAGWRRSPPGRRSASCVSLG